MKRLAPDQLPQIPHPFERVPDGPIATLPQELLQNIAFHLDFTSKVSASMVSGSFNQATFWEEKDAVFADFLPFLEILLNNLDSYPEQKEAISSMIDAIRGAGGFPASLLIESRKMRELFPEYKEKVIDVFKALAPDDLNGVLDAFEGKPQPYFFYELQLLSEKHNNNELLLKVKNKDQEKIRELLDSGAIVTQDILDAALVCKLPLEILTALFASSPFSKYPFHLSGDLSTILKLALTMKVDFDFIKTLIQAGARATEACFPHVYSNPAAVQYLLDTGFIPTTALLNRALNRKQVCEKIVTALLNAGATPCATTLNYAIFYKYSTELVLRLIEIMKSTKRIPTCYDVEAAFFSADNESIISALLAAGLVVTRDLLNTAKLRRISPETLNALKAAYIEAQTETLDKE